MKIRSIDDLPSELLHLILIKGCEEPPDPSNTPCPRILKGLADHARLVSRKWQALIDTPTNSWSFWVSRLFLVVQDSENRTLSSIPFARRVADFHRGLASSQGCDLEITFVVPKTLARISPNGLLSSRLSSFLRLLLYALDHIILYQAQVIVLRVAGNPPHIYYHILEIIATRWMVAPRLTIISFEQPILSKESDMPKTISDLIGLPDLLGLDSILQAYSPIPKPVTLTHLGSLDTLVIPSCSWLNGELELPMRLRYLKVTISEHPNTLRISYRSETAYIAKPPSVDCGGSVTCCGADPSR